MHPLGIQWGQTVANAMVAWRAADGFANVPPPVTGGLGEGEWRPTPTGFAPFSAVQLGFTTTWVLPFHRHLVGRNAPEFVVDQIQ